MMKKFNYKSLIIGLSFLGLLDSLYLTWVKLSGNSAFCAGVGDCDTVNASEFSEFAGIPIAILGAGAYLIILVLSTMENQSDFLSEYVPYSIFGMSLIGVIYSGYLTYIELAVLFAVCPYCVISAVLITLIFVLSAIRVFSDEEGENDNR